MFVGHIDNLAIDEKRLEDAVNKGLKFIKDNDIVNMKPGKYEIEGDKLYAMVQSYQSRTKDAGRPEAHRKFLDIQYIAKGREYIGYCAFNPKMEVAEDCLEEKDVIFYKNVFPESDVLLTEGMYAVLYPEDVHRPCTMVATPEDNIKVVVKISVDLVK